MLDLFIRTTSEGLQGLLPAAFAAAAFRRLSRADAATGVRWGVMCGAIATAPAGWLFQRAARQSLWEAALAVVALACVVLILYAGRRRGSLPTLAVAAVTSLLVTRQTMEIAAVFGVAAFDLSSLEAMLAVGGGAMLAIAVACAWTSAARRFSAPTIDAATRIFAVLFVAQLLMYAVHESAESRLLPWSEPVHSATEPYGPDGIYGQHFSWLLIAVPLGVAGFVARRRRRRHRVPSGKFSRAGRYAYAAGLALITLGDGASLRSAGIRPAAASQDVLRMTGAAHVLFRHTDVDAAYNTLSVASLANPSAQRLSLGIPCERIAFGAGRGICLQASRGVFTTYRAILFDRQFKTLATWSLDGSPSRTRVAPDGRVGAITVFVAGHGYGTSSFSTKTTLVDMASGDLLGDLEDFTTWRDGSRIKAQDFNFWGVTFGRDSGAFYATLGTAGKTYLVRGDLALRKLTVVREGIECPSLSPDGRWIAFKKRTGEGAGLWRLALLDLSTMSERPVNESRHVDDQVEWLDGDRLLYAIPREGSAVTDVWVAQVDGAAPPRIFLPAAESPIVVRPAQAPLLR